MNGRFCDRKHIVLLRCIHYVVLLQADNLYLNLLSLSGTQKSWLLFKCASLDPFPTCSRFHMIKNSFTLFEFLLCRFTYNYLWSSKSIFMSYVERWNTDTEFLIYLTHKLRNDVCKWYFCQVLSEKHCIAFLWLYIKVDNGHISHSWTGSALQSFHSYLVRWEVGKILKKVLEHWH